VRSTWLVLAALAGTTGCYKYVETAPSSVSAGTEVAVDLTSVGSANVKEAIGDFVTQVEGSVTEASGAGITLSLTSVKRRGDVSPSTWNGETLRLNGSDIAGVKTRQFSRGRTTAAAVGLGAATVGLVAAIAKATGLIGGSGGTGKPIPPP
jgi:hypothetical protein